jgi:hypothetical protein
MRQYKTDYKIPVKIYIHFSLLFIVFYLITKQVSAQKNSGFEAGLEGWEVSGEVGINEGNGSYKGRFCIKLESLASEVFLHEKVNPYAIVHLTAFAKTS